MHRLRLLLAVQQYVIIGCTTTWYDSGVTHVVDPQAVRLCVPTESVPLQLPSTIDLSVLNPADSHRYSLVTNPTHAMTTPA